MVKRAGCCGSAVQEDVMRALGRLGGCGEEQIFEKF